MGGWEGGCVVCVNVCTLALVCVVGGGGQTTLTKTSTSLVVTFSVKLRSWCLI